MITHRAAPSDEETPRAEGETFFVRKNQNGKITEGGREFVSGAAMPLKCLRSTSRTNNDNNNNLPQ